jgi:hypothetical protein
MLKYKMLGQSFRKRIQDFNLPGFISKSKNYGEKASKLLNSVENIYGKIKNEIPANYRDDIERGLGSLNKNVNTYNRVISAF